MRKDICLVQSAEGLCVILDAYLSFDDHITTTVSKCIARLAQINPVKHCLDKSSLLINALVSSKMYYCSSVWANTTDKNIQKLQAVQNFACRIVSGTGKYDHVTPVLKRLSWLPVKEYIFYRQAVMAFKCITGQAPKYLTDQFITREQVSNRRTRSSQRLNLPLFRTASGHRTLYYRTIRGAVVHCPLVHCPLVHCPRKTQRRRSTRSNKSFVGGRWSVGAAARKASDGRTLSWNQGASLIAVG